MTWVKSMVAVAKGGWGTGELEISDMEIVMIKKNYFTISLTVLMVHLIQRHLMVRHVGLHHFHRTDEGTVGEYCH
jgi:hypothetical protein